MSEQPLSAAEVFDKIGHEGFQRLVHGFYQRVATDDLLRPMYPSGDLEPAERRLRQFLEQYFGGPTTYSEQRGHPRLRARHLRFPIDVNARNRWVELMVSALEAAALPDEVTLIMRDYFENSATFLINQLPDMGSITTQPPQA